MNILLFSASLSAGFGLWVTVCRIDRGTSWPHIIATILMTAGVATLLLWAFGMQAVTPNWLINGLTALLFGLAIWLAFDRRYPSHELNETSRDKPCEPSSDAEKHAAWYEGLVEGDCYD